MFRRVGGCALALLVSACGDDAVAAVSPAIVVSPKTLELGPTPVGALKSHALEVSNAGSAALSVSAVSLLGPDGAAPSDDLALSLTETLPRALGPTQSFTIGVDHLPRDLVLDEGLVRIASDDPSHPSLDVPITQTPAGAPRIVGVPDAEAAKVEARTPGGLSTTIEAIHLGVVGVGVRKRFTLYVVNGGDGNVPLSVTRAHILEANAELDATATPALPRLLPPIAAQTLQPGAQSSFAVEVSWAPTMSGETLAATLRLESNDPAHPNLDIPIDGSTSAVDPPILRLDPPSGLDFGGVLVGMRAERTLTIHNDGASLLPLEALTLSSTEAFSFTAQQGPTMIAPGSMRTVTIAFAPRAPGAKAATVAILSSSPAVMPVSYPLTGDGTEVVMCTPAQIDPNEPANGSCATATARGTLNLANNMESSVTVSDAQLELAMDEDYQRFELAVDVGCSFGTGYDIHAAVQVAPGDQAEVCFYVGDCAAPTRQACAPAGGDARATILFGQPVCEMYSNRVPVFVRVRHTAGDPTCQPYTLTFRAR